MKNWIVDPATKFDFQPHEFVPFKDKAVLERVRNMSGLEHVTDLNFTYRASGGIDISGSKLTLNVACRNYMKHTGASIVDVFRYASYNPSRVIGLLDRGEIAVGKRADLVIVDHWMKVNKVIFKGEMQ